MYRKKWVYSLYLLIFLIMFNNNSALSQRFSQVYRSISRDRVDRAYTHLQKFQEENLNSHEDLALFGIAYSLLFNNNKFQDYNPYASYDIFNSTVENVTDIYEVSEFLEKYDLNLKDIEHSIYQNILTDAKIENTEHAYQKALTVCNYCFYKEEVESLLEKTSYNNAKIIKTISAYKDFLISYPNSIFKNEIEILLYDLAFKEAKDVTTLESMNTYIEEYSYPNNPYLEIAFQIRDSIVFSNTPKTYFGYLNFLNNYPNSEYVTEINEELPNMLIKEASKNNKIDLFELFVTNYPNDSRIKEVRALIEKLYYEKLIVNRSAEEFSEFKKRFPKSVYIDELQLIIEDDYKYFTDDRDGNVYRTIKIGRQIWMAENLRYKGAEHVPTPYNIHSIISGTKVSKEDYSKNYGESYFFDIAQDVCPLGWHLPSKDEWEELFIHINKNAYKESVDERRHTAWYEIGDYLMNRDEFVRFHANHNFTSKFNVLGTGSFSFGSNFTPGSAPQVINKGGRTSFWTSTRGANRYLAVIFFVGTTRKIPYNVARVSFEDYWRHSFVRCVKSR